MTGPLQLPSPAFIRRRVLREATLRRIDLVAYTVIALSGVLALLQPPASVVAALPTPAIVVWGIALIVSGTVGLIGRLTRYWIIEAPGTLSGALFASVYLVVLLYTTIVGHLTGFVGSGFVTCMSLLLFRRYTELRLFTSDPGERPLPVRARDAFHRRTKDSITSDLH